MVSVSDNAMCREAAKAHKASGDLMIEVLILEHQVEGRGKPSERMGAAITQMQNKMDQVNAILLQCRLEVQQVTNMVETEMEK